MFVKTLLLQWW